MATANNKGWYANNDDDNDYYDYLVPIANESIYFSALDTCSMDEHMNDSTSSSSSSSSLNYYSSLSPKTMRRQRLLAEDDESAYTSLRPVNQYTAAEVNETQPKTSEKSDEQDSILAAYAQLEEFEKVGRRSLDYFRYSESLDRLEKTIFNSFENKVKSRKIKHYNIDQTIEETLEEADYENVLDELIKKMALQNSTSSTNSSSSSSNSSKRYINTDNKENVNICPDNSKKRRPLSIVNQNKESIVSSSSSSSSDDYSKSSYLSSCSSSSSLNYSTVKPVTIIERRYHNQERVESKNAAANIVKKREERSKDEDLEILDECSSEFPLLEHAFNLVRRCNFGWDRFRRHELYSKFVGFVQQGSCTVIRSVASVFMSLMRLDFHELLKSFISLPFKNRWNVLKNLIYYAVKLSLSAISNFFIDDGGEAFSRIVHSIYNYIANFTRLFLKFNR